LQSFPDRINGITELRNSGKERRSHQRYPIDLEIRCRALRSDIVVLGKVCDISSGGVRFMSDCRQTVGNFSGILAPGKKVELSIDWPILLDGTCRLQLRGQGRIVRSDEHGTAIEIEHHEFCTRKAQSAAVCRASAVGG